jgi:hypothetical protein
MGRIRVLAKKTFSLSLVFNSLLTIACAVGVLAGFYWIYRNWQPFYPFLLNGNVIWFAVAAAILNIFPSACVGRSLKTGRFLFHHYFYGFLVLFFTAIYIFVFSPVSILSIFFVNNTTAVVNVGRFFILGGLTLILDDLPDVSKKIETILNGLKSKAYQSRKILMVTQFAVGAFTFYLFVASCLFMSQNPQWITIANILFVGTVFITSITSLIFAKRKFWSNLSDNQKVESRRRH